MLKPLTHKRLHKMQTITGSIYPLTVEGLTLDADRSGRYLELRTQESLTIFKKIALQEPDLSLNMLGLFAHVPVGRDGKARFARIGPPKHVISNRKSGCAWNPKGGVTMGIDSFPVCPEEIQMEECPDAFYGDCFERIFGVGNEVRDLMGTAEGASLVQMIISQIYLGIGNSFSELFHFANHPLIDVANTDGFYPVEEKEWLDYYDQQMTTECGGLVTQLDELYAMGVDGFNNEIPDSDINQTTQEYIGDIEGLFNGLINKARGAFASWIMNGASVGTVMSTVPQLYLPAPGNKIFPIILCTKWEYQAYEDALVAKFTEIPEIYRYYVSKNSGDRMLVPGVLRYKGLPVVLWDEISTFDAITGAVSHRVVIAAPGAFGIAHDVPSLRMFEGMGLRIQQRLDLPFQGKIFFDTTFKWGAGIADKDFIVMATNVKHP